MSMTPKQIDNHIDAARRGIDDLRSLHYERGEHEQHRAALAVHRALDLANGLHADYIDAYEELAEDDTNSGPVVGPPDPEPPPEPPPGPDGVYRLRNGETVAEALLQLDGRRAIELPDGITRFGETDGGWKRSGPGEDVRITVRGAPGTDRDKVIVVGDGPGSGSIRPYCVVTFEGVSFDFSTFSRFNGKGFVFKNCRWFDSNLINAADPDHPATFDTVPESTTRLTPVSTPYVIEDSLIHDMLYAAVGADAVRRCEIRTIYGDVFLNSRIVEDCNVTDVRGEVLKHHTDIFQVDGPLSGVRWRNIKINDVAKVRIFMLESVTASDEEYTYCEDWIVENIKVDSGELGPSMLMGGWKNAVFRNVFMPKVHLWLRGNGPHPPSWEDVRFINCTFKPGSIGDGPLPQGVTVE